MFEMSQYTCLFTIILLCLKNYFYPINFQAGPGQCHLLQRRLGQEVQNRKHPKGHLPPGRRQHRRDRHDVHVLRVPSRQPQGYRRQGPRDAVQGQSPLHDFHLAARKSRKNGGGFVRIRLFRPQVRSVDQVRRPRAQVQDRVDPRVERSPQEPRIDRHVRRTQGGLLW
jgi:hypothetical protein